MPWSQAVKKSKKKGDWSAPKNITCEPKASLEFLLVEWVQFVDGPWDRQSRLLPEPVPNTIHVPVMEGPGFRVQQAMYNVRRQNGMETFAYYVGTN